MTDGGLGVVPTAEPIAEGVAEGDGDNEDDVDMELTNGSRRIRFNCSNVYLKFVCKHIW